ncbi:hypothetical protein WDU94_008010 [Cyamophila willieti]
MLTSVVKHESEVTYKEKVSTNEDMENIAWKTGFCCEHMHIRNYKRCSTYATRIIRGRPNPAIFKSHPTGRYKDNYNITWAVNSYTPIEEFKLLFRKVPVHNDNVNYQYQHSKRPTRRQDNDTFGSHLSNQWARSDIWNDVVVPNSPTEQFTQQMSYLIRGLEPGTQYEAKVMAKNRFGWNQMSESFKFQTTSDYVQADPDNELSVFPGLSFFSDAEKTLGVTSLGIWITSVELKKPILGFGNEFNQKFQNSPKRLNRARRRKCR